MKIHILSDLHVEFRQFTPEVPPETDVVVLAGDITTRGRAGFWAAANFSHPTVLIGGNHDSYQTSLQRAHRLMSRDCAEHVHFLENDIFECKGVRFLGCTAWTDFKSTGNQPLAMLQAQSQMNDYKMIRFEPKFRRLHPNDTRSLAEYSRSWLFEEAQKPFPGKTVIITHTPPLISLLPEVSEPDHLDAAYANNWPEFLDLNIDLWIFGHTHHPVDRRIGGIRFISNPRGYPGENVAFKPDFLVTL
ncbi:metallophosphoesterase [Stutzerimonas stutzeri]|uniref:Calcineurin-like phosphoesterase domain-containing protein n=1 Tax=Stutzerimonas stutzeri TaxID=316 RepID=A0A6I6LKT0_STUST|nr:metallophosphoesterase [Stutzerimonas stutzeri]QGZ31154.1 hypothetical protein GQA94_14190 [Stutzerimonas stutzeri]